MLEAPVLRTYTYTYTYTNTLMRLNFDRVHTNHLLRSMLCNIFHTPSIDPPSVRLLHKFLIHSNFG